MHLELRETMARVGADIKQKIIDTFKSVYNFASLQKNDPKMLQQEVDKVGLTVSLFFFFGHIVN